MVINANISGTPSSLRKVHRMLTLRNLLHDDYCSRKSLAKKLGISSMAMSRISGDLINAGLILESGFIKNDNIPGPNQINLTINKNSVFGVGIVLSAFKTEIGIVGANGEIIVSQNIELENISDGMKAILILIQKVKELIRFKDIETSKILGVGISVAADLDSSKNKILGAGYLGWKPFDIKKTVEDHLSLPTFIEKKVEGRVLGPVSAPIFRLKRKYRIRLLIRGSKSLKLQSSIAKIIPNYKFPKGIKLSVDVDPINFN